MFALSIFFFFFTFSVDWRLSESFSSDLSISLVCVLRAKRRKVPDKDQWMGKREIAPTQDKRTFIHRPRQYLQMISKGMFIVCTVVVVQRAVQRSRPRFSLSVHWGLFSFVSVERASERATPMINTLGCCQNHDEGRRTARSEDT